MHGTLNGFGLTFPQAFLGVKLPFALQSSGIGQLQIRPSYFLKGAEFPAPPPPPPPPPPLPPCLGGLVSECGSSVTVSVACGSTSVRQSVLPSCRGNFSD